MGLLRLAVFSGIFWTALLLAEHSPPTFRLLAVSSLIGWICLYFEPRLSLTMRDLSLRSRIRRSALHLVHSLPLESLEPMSRGDWLRRVVHDLFKIEKFLLESVPRQLGSFVVGTAAILVASVGLKAWTPLLVLIGAVLFLAGWVIENGVRDRKKLQEKSDDILESIWLESLEGIRTVHVHQAEAYFQRRFDNGVTKQSRDQQSPTKTRLAALAEPVLALVVLSGVLSISWTDLVSGPAELYLLFVLPLAKSAWECGRAMCGWSDIQQELGTFAEKLHPDQTGSHWSNRSDTQGIAKTSKLSLRQAFWETSEDWAGPLEWSVKRGELWLVTGPSDSGKSALLEVLAGLRTLSDGQIQSGEVTVRPGERVPVGLCSYVEQYPFIFQGTLRENLSFVTEQKLSDVQLWRVLERVGLVPWVRELGGLDAKFGAHGRDLLKAEKYRIALARILLLDRPFILLDEPFSHFDDKTISLLAEILEEEKRTKGIVVVSRFIPKEIMVDGVISVTEFETKRTNSWGAITRLKETSVQ